jgi:hypothetical protein
MPITLEKLFSPTAEFEIEFLGETIKVSWQPWRYTAEMQELAEKLTGENAEQRAEVVELAELVEQQTAQADRLEEAGADPDEVARLRVEAEKGADEITSRQLVMATQYSDTIRKMLASLVVDWDVLDENGQPVPTTEAQMKRLPTRFLMAVWNGMTAESQPDPTKEARSNGASNTEKGSAKRSPSGTGSCAPRARSGSHRSTSTKGRGGRKRTRSGARGQ